MLPNNLNTNEVKTSAGVEVEFLYHDKQGQVAIYAIKDENPSQPQRIMFRHEEVGKPGTLGYRRRSNMNISVTKLSEVDSVTPVTGRFNATVDLPEGHSTTRALADLLLAYAVSLLASDGSSTTISFAGNGTAAQVLADGTL